MTHICNDRCSKPTYDPKVGWSKLISVTGGTFPTWEEFEAHFNTVCADSDNLMNFSNDEFVGTDKLTSEELWSLLGEVWDNHTQDDISEEAWGLAYSWCSDVMDILGWEWVLPCQKLAVVRLIVRLKPTSLSYM